MTEMGNQDIEFVDGGAARTGGPSGLWQKKCMWMRERNMT